MEYVYGMKTKEKIWKKEIYYKFRKKPNMYVWEKEKKFSRQIFGKKNQNQI
jgi:hypothetical protein